MRVSVKLKTLWNTIRLIISAVPVNSFLALLLSLALMFYYTFSVKVTAQLFESAAVFFSSFGNGFDMVIKYAVVFAVMRLLQSIIIFLNGFNGNVYVYRKATAVFRQKLSSKAAKLPLISYEDAGVNDMFARAQAVVTDERLSSQFMGILDILNGCFSVAGIAAVLAGYSPGLLLIAIPSVLPFFIIRMVRGREFYRMKYFQAKTQRSMDYYWRLMFDKNSMKEIHTYTFFEYIKTKWSLYRDDVDNKTWDFKRKDATAIFLSNIIAVGGYLLSIAFSVCLLLDGRIRVGAFGACLSAFSSMQSYTKKFLVGFGNIFEDLQFNKDYFDFINLPDEADGIEVLQAMPQRILLEHIYFRYPNSDDYAIKDVSLVIKKGESVAFVGENGSGKTTLIKLILGLYECESGQVLIDNSPLSKVQKESLYDRMSVMLQSPLNHKATIREAVALSNIDFLHDDQKIMNALRMAKIDYIIGENGLDTRIGKEFGGRELSGGEWQRVALARALFKNSDFMVLDEPTSAIDPISEMEILKTFLDNFRGKTSIIVTHRVGICTCVDKVVLVREGQIREYGSHEELMDRNEEYSRMFAAQAKWYQ